jgi:hypothetical protein
MKYLHTMAVLFASQQTTHTEQDPNNPIQPDLGRDQQMGHQCIFHTTWSLG